MAVNIPIKLPITSVKANPWTKLVPKPNKIKPTKIVVRLPSRIAGQARRTAEGTAAPREPDRRARRSLQCWPARCRPGGRQAPGRGVVGADVQAAAE